MIIGEGLLTGVQNPVVFIAIVIFIIIINSDHTCCCIQYLAMASIICICYDMPQPQISFKVVVFFLRFSDYELPQELLR